VLEAGTADFGIIASGAAYKYAREAFPKGLVLEARSFAPAALPEGHQALSLCLRASSSVEELDPYIEARQVRHAWPAR